MMAEAEDVGGGAEQSSISRALPATTLPSNPVACAVAIADKMDTTGGYLRHRSASEGDKDPLRCAAPR